MMRQRIRGVAPDNGDRQWMQGAVDASLSGPAFQARRNLVQTRTGGQGRRWLWATRPFDLLISSLGLVGSLPVWQLIAVSIKLDDGGPVFYSQERVGMGGRRYRSYKFRSIIPESDRRFGPLQAREHDHRVTRVGRFLLTKHLGLGAPCEFLQGAQTEVAWVWTEGTEVHLNKAFSPEAFAWVVPLQNGYTRVGVMRARQARAALERVLDQMVPPWRGRPDIRLAAKPIAQTPLRRSYTERVLVIGEAAGQVKATTGGGIYYGLLAAQLAADTIHSAFATGDLSAASRRAYERAWRALLLELVIETIEDSAITPGATPLQAARRTSESQFFLPTHCPTGVC